MRVIWVFLVFFLYFFLYFSGFYVFIGVCCGYCVGVFIQVVVKIYLLIILISSCLYLLLMAAYSSPLSSSFLYHISIIHISSISLHSPQSPYNPLNNPPSSSLFLPLPPSSLIFPNNLTKHKQSPLFSLYIKFLRILNILIFILRIYNYNV